MEAIAAAILPYLLPRDVLNLSMVSRDFHDVFNSNAVWMTIFDRYFDIPVPRNADFGEIDWKMSCANLLQQSPDDQDLHQKFCISSNCHLKNASMHDEFAEVCLKPSKAQMNLLEWDFSSLGLEFELESSSDSDTLEKVCIEDLRCTTPENASPLHSISQGSNTNLLVNSSVSANSIVDRVDEKTPEIDVKSIVQEFSFFTFTREALHRRLQNLVNRSLKSSANDPELTLPGNLTKKFALRYRTE